MNATSKVRSTAKDASAKTRDSLRTSTFVSATVRQNGTAGSRRGSACGRSLGIRARCALRCSCSESLCAHRCFRCKRTCPDVVMRWRHALMLSCVLGVSGLDDGNARRFCTCILGRASHLGRASLLHLHPWPCCAHFGSLPTICSLDANVSFLSMVAIASI